jgi:hypothetical protein
VRDVKAVVDDLAARRLDQPGDEARRRGLPAAGLADEPEGLAASNIERDTVDGMHQR